MLQPATTGRAGRHCDKLGLRFHYPAPNGCGHVDRRTRGNLEFTPAPHAAPPRAKFAVLTFDSTSCTDDLLGLDDPDHRARVVFRGIEGSKYGIRPTRPMLQQWKRMLANASCVSELRIRR